MGTSLSVTSFADAYKNHDMKRQDRTNLNIDRDLKRQKKQAEQKLLLLGPGESGKSTILKQMKIIHSAGFSEQEIMQQKFYIRHNITQSMANILKAMSALQISISPERQDDIGVVQEAMRMSGTEGGTFSWNFELTQAIKRLWQDKAVQKCYKRRSEFQLNDSAKCFFDEIDRISNADYRPTQEDILRCRVKTTGVVEVRFKMKGMLFRVVDVGGQRSERRKWIKCFSGVDSIIFIASLSEYNQTLEEDETTVLTSESNVGESLGLFEWICKHELFRKTPIILFLNKKDLFADKIHTVPITVAFPDYTGPQEAKECTQYIKGRYLTLNPDPKRFIYTHETCATDTNQVSFVINSSIETIMDANLTSTGLN